MPRRQGYKLVFMADGTTQMRHFRFNRQTIWIGVSVLAVTALALLWGSARMIAGGMTRKAMTGVLEENHGLREQIGGLKDRVLSLDQKIEQLAVSDDHLRLANDMPRLDKDVREVGIGGAVTNASDYGVQDPDLREIISSLDKMEREVELQRNSYDEIEKRMSGRQDLLLHTPSIRPVNGGYISSSFGRRTDPFSGRPAFHKGLDFPIERGTPVHATADGRVVFAQPTPGLGKLVVIDHGFGFQTAYGHLSSILVSKGQSITRNQKVGLTGASGRASGPHLHYEVHVNGVAVDPRDFMFNDEESLAGVAKRR